MSKAESNAIDLKNNNNLLKIGQLQNDLIRAQNTAFKVDVTSEVLFAPFFDSNGHPIDITATPSPNAYGYDVGVTNGGLYSAQLNVTKNLFNSAITNNLLFQNQIKNDALGLSSETILHNVHKNVIDAYINAYQLQQQIEFIKTIQTDLNKRLEVVELLVKRGILLESDYLLLKLDIESKNLELQQARTNFDAAVAQLYNLGGLPIEAVTQLAAPELTLQVNAPQRYYEKTFANDSLQILADQNVFENLYRPQVSLYGNTGLNAVELNNIDHKFGLSAGLKLTIPIYDGSQKKFNALQSEVKQESLGATRENAKIQLENNLKSVQKQIESLQISQQLISKQLEQQQNILDIYKGKLVQGQVSIIDYLNVVQNYKMNVFAQLQMQTNLLLLYNQYNFTNW
ncbi:MAG: TolC family protein [Aquaticitalea sp.]